MRRMKFLKLAPVDGGNFCVTDDTIVEFCMQQEFQDGQEEDGGTKRKLHGELVMDTASTTQNLFKRLVDVSTRRFSVTSLNNSLIMD